MSVTEQSLVLADGRTVELTVAGDPDRPAVVFHHGTPGVAERYAPLVDAVTARGLRWIARTRPGYAGSTRRPGRTVADDAGDTAEVLDALGVQRFVAMGWSGGGPHALACGALLAERCAGVVGIAGVAPFDGVDRDGLDFLAGMGPENIEEFGAAVEGEPALRPMLERFGDGLREVTGEQLGEAFGGLVDLPDLAVLRGGFGDDMAAQMRRALSTGVDGWLDDDLAFVSPWGFGLDRVQVPVAWWQGSEDRMVPFAHGRWLAARLPDVEARLLPGEGHLSLAVGRFDDIADDASRLVAA